MAIFLTIHTRYQFVEIGLYRDKSCLYQIRDENKRISRNFISLLQDILAKQDIALEDLDFIAANQGPAPFTTLRVILASINGLSFATDIPLVGVDSLQAFVQEYSSCQYAYIVALLNAFSHDVYYGVLHQESHEIKTGYDAVETCLQQLRGALSDQSVLFIGNGVDLYKRSVLSYFGEKAYFLDPNPEVVSLNAIAYQAVEQWNGSAPKVYELMPLYLKSYSPTLQHR